MAPELKRVRSKPAEWWAAQPSASDSSPATREAPLPSKKRDSAKSPTYETQNSRSKGNAVKRKSRGNEEDEENVDPESSKLVRRGRSSVGEKESTKVGENRSTNTQFKQPTTLLPQSSNNSQNDTLPKTSKRRKPSVPAQEDEDDEQDPLAQDHVAQKKSTGIASHHNSKGDDTVQNIRGPVSKEKQIASNDSSTIRRGRSSNTEAEIKAINYKEAATRKSNGPNIEAKISNVVNKANIPKQSVVKGAEEAQPNQNNNNTFKKPALPPNSSKAPTEGASIRRGRSSNTEAELQAINYKETSTRKQSSLHAGDDAQVTSKISKVSGQNKSSDQATETRTSTEKTVSMREPAPVKKAGKVSSKDVVLSRRGRSSNTEAELQTVNYKETATRRQARTDDAVEPSTSPIENTSSVAVGDHRRGRSSNTEAGLRRQVNYKETKTLGRPVVSEPIMSQQSSTNTASQGKPKYVTRRQETMGGTIGGLSRTEQDESSQNIDVEFASSKFSKSRTKSTAKPIVEAKTTAAKAQSTSKASGNIRNNRKGTEAAVVTRQLVAKPNLQSQSSQKKRKSVAEEAIPELPAPKRQRGERAQEQDPPEKAPVYQHLGAITRKVSLATIDSKWETIPSSCTERISGLLQDIQRPVLARISEEQKRSQASTILQTLSRKLINKIKIGFPFPPSIRNNREDDFDFEKILDQTRSMEAQLTPALHANELLQAELDKEETLLLAEQAYLDELESNAKAESSKRKQDARNIHALLQPSGATIVERLDDDFSINITDPKLPVTPDLLQDANLQAVVADLQGHVDSIEGNLKQVEGVTEAMAKSKAAVQAALFGRLDSTQYEDLVLG